MGSFLIRPLLSSNLQRQTLLEKYLLWIILEDRLYGRVDPLELTWPLGTRKINISFFFFPIHFIHCHFSLPNLLWLILEFLSYGTQREVMCEQADTLRNWYSILNMSEQPGRPGMRQSKCVMWRNGTWRSVLEGRLKGSDGSFFSPSGFREWTYARELPQLHDDSSIEQPHQLLTVTTRWFLYRTQRQDSPQICSS